jgi:hypothetical protein
MMRLVFYRWVPLLLLIGTVVTSRAQNRLAGEITDKANTPLPGVSIHFGAGFLQTISDMNGKFSFTYPDTLKICRRGCAGLFPAYRQPMTMTGN